MILMAANQDTVFRRLGDAMGRPSWPPIRATVDAPRAR